MKLKKILICHHDAITCAREDDDGEWLEEVLGIWTR
jgi:hypothetical protein